ncbi:MAG TPA: DUF6788 family protein [Vicinamibacteria bacterium]|jgi:hypothetical protein|nr:DUF6788 family protein [Vicinamibacteria bacterium]
MNESALRDRVRSKLLEQREVVASLLRLREQLQGSLFTRYGECGKPGCACRAGRRHGPYYVLSAKSASQSGFAYLEGRRLGEARALVARYRAFRDGFRRLKTVNAELVALLSRYQKAMVRKGGQKLGIGVQL